MLKSLTLGLCLPVLLGAVFFHPATACAGEDIVAMVAETPVTEYELNREMQRILPMNTSFHGGISAEKIAEVREQVLNNLIEQGYKAQFALEQKLRVSRAEREERLKNIREKFTTEKALQDALGKEKIEDFYQSIDRMLLARKAEELAVGSKTKISESEIRDFYERNKKMFNRPKQYRASHILIKVDPARIATDKEPARLKAEELAERARNGEDFYNLAYYNSDDRTKMVGGDIGYFHSGQIVREFEDAIADLSPGDVAGPVETLAGFHVIKLTEVNEPKQLEFEEVKDKIRRQQEKKKYDLLYADWMSALKSKYSHQLLLREVQ
ncbi:MAG: peptidylprolyl isomerase [Desulfuromonadales bacterium]|nr:peptidylprolyl isomerase [Desulfuromonadales bacterium]MBN2791504.1 peptidylprolyl isomerase [Desulfuromonadales bacterium]